jgi:DNA (cytosine-5)-methyltransferase 1
MNILSLCTGYGGLDLGFQRVFPESNVLAYCDIEAFACANLVSKMEKGLIEPCPIWTDLKTFPYSDFSNRVDAVIAGFPCQPFSRENKYRKTTDDPRHLFPSIVKGIKDLNYPSLLMFENVEGLLSKGKNGLREDTEHESKGDTILYHCLREIERLGYYVTAGLFSCKEVGAPMPRKRVYIAAIRSKVTESVRQQLDTFEDVEYSTLLTSLMGLISSDNYDIVETAKQKKAQAFSVTDFGGNMYDFFSVLSMFTEDTKSYNLETAFPSGVGEPQHAWEPPRYIRRKLETTGKARTIDEMMLLGNGVVPSQAEFALRTLLRELLGRK